jgi:hypothetical protein
MSEFVVHSIPDSPFGRAVLATLEEKNPCRLAPLAPGAHRSPEHLARHPFGRVPVLEHGRFSLYETQAILRYLDRAWVDALIESGVGQRFSTGAGRPKKEWITIGADHAALWQPLAEEARQHVSEGGVHAPRRIRPRKSPRPGEIAGQT